jgi:hypothetical protein
MRVSQIRLLLSALLAATLYCGHATARERPETAPAARFLQDTIAQALDLARPPVSQQAGADLAALINEAMDWPSLTHFALGKYDAHLDHTRISSATGRLEDQLTNLARQAGFEWPTMTVEVHGMRIDPDGSRRILSTATVPRFGEVEVEWKLAPVSVDGLPAGYRIEDIKALGMTLRQFLRGWVSSLVAARGGDAAAAFGGPADASPQ